MKKTSITKVLSTVLFFCAFADYSNAQGRVRVPPPPTAPRGPGLAPPAAPPPEAPEAPAPITPSTPTTLVAIGRSNTEIDLTWTASTEAGGTIAAYRIESCSGAGCTPSAAIGTSATTSYSDTGLTASVTHGYRVVAIDAAGKKSNPSNVIHVTTASSSLTCSLFPTRGGCMDFQGRNQPGGDKSATINAFYQTSGPYSFFNQVKSTYNQASGAATVSADLATLNFNNGMQVAVTTNAQAGSSGTTTPSSGTVPTLSANGAAQATQNLLYGGTFLVSEMYPLLAVGVSKLGSPGGFGVSVDFIAKEGADIQNFKSGTNVSVTSPPFHGSAHMEGYLQYNSINLATGSQNFAGALFLGGGYGYNYMSRGYANDYGFKNMNNGIGQLSFGVVINGVARITVSRAFGPSQTYMDSTTKAVTTLNNFKAWSFGIVYQSATPSK